MKRLNPIQVAASAAGAVLAAVIASFFGVEGTIIGTAIGSIVATTVSAIVWESIERGHAAVRQVVVKEHAPFLRHGTTESAGEVTSAEIEASAVEAQVDAGLDAQATAGRPAEGTGAARPLGETAAAGQAEVRQQSPMDSTRQERAGRAELPAVDGAGSAGGASGGASGGATGAAPGALSFPGAEATGQRRLLTSSRSGRPAQVRRTATLPEGGGRRRGGAFQRRWVIVASIVGVFAVALGVVTAVEAIAGRPLSSLMGGSTTTGGTSAGNLISGGHGPASTTTTRPASTSTTTTSPSSSTTTTSPPTTSATTTTTPSTSSSTTTTTTPKLPATTAAPGTGTGAGAEG